MRVGIDVWVVTAQNDGEHLIFAVFSSEERAQEWVAAASERSSLTFEISLAFQLDPPPG